MSLAQLSPSLYYLKSANQQIFFHGGVIPPNKENLRPLHHQPNTIDDGGVQPTENINGLKSVVGQHLKPLLLSQCRVSDGVEKHIRKEALSTNIAVNIAVNMKPNHDKHDPDLNKPKITTLKDRRAMIVKKLGGNPDPDGKVDSNPNLNPPPQLKSPIYI